MTGHEINEIQRVFANAPGALEAIKQRGMEHPEYRTWLEQFGRGVLAAAEQEESKAKEARARE